MFFLKIRTNIDKGVKIRPPVNVCPFSFKENIPYTHGYFASIPPPHSEWKTDFSSG